MVTLGTVTYKNQLTIPKKIIENSGLKNTRKVLIEVQGDNIVIKPVHSSIDELAGSLSSLKKSLADIRKDEKKIRKQIDIERTKGTTDLKKIRELTRKIAAIEIAKEGLEDE